MGEINLVLQKHEKQGKQNGRGAEVDGSCRVLKDHEQVMGKGDKEEEEERELEGGSG